MQEVKKTGNEGDASRRRKMKVFLGGTCAESTWREELIQKLTINHFNPVVPDWNEEAYQEELRQRESCDKCLYVLTSQMKGVYSIAEVVDDSNKRPDKAMFCFIEEGFDVGMIKSLSAVGMMVQTNGGLWVEDFANLHYYLNIERSDELTVMEIAIFQSTKIGSADDRKKIIGRLSDTDLIKCWLFWNGSPNDYKHWLLLHKEYKRRGFSWPGLSSVDKYDRYTFVSDEVDKIRNT